MLEVYLQLHSGTRGYVVGVDGTLVVDIRHLVTLVQFHTPSSALYRGGYLDDVEHRRVDEVEAGDEIDVVCNTCEENRTHLINTSMAHHFWSFSPGMIRQYYIVYWMELHEKDSLNCKPLSLLIMAINVFMFPSRIFSAKCKAHSKGMYCYKIC